MSTKRETVKKPYTPLTGRPCSCRPGIVRDNCTQCEGTGKRIDFAKIRARHATPKNPQGPTPYDPEPGSHADRIREKLGAAKVAELLAHLPKGSLVWSYDVHATRTGTTFYALRVFSSSCDAPTIPGRWEDGASTADRTYYLGKDVAEALGATFKQADHWQGWHGDLHPARAVALLGEVLYGSADAFSHRGIA
jgi:hypothetical protein